MRQRHFQTSNTQKSKLCYTAQLLLAHIFIPFLFFSLPAFCYGQATDLIKEALSFEPMEQPWSVQWVLEVPSYAFYLGAPDVQGVSYQPNVNFKMGTRVSWNDFGATLTLPFALPEAERTRRGESQQFAMVLNKYWRDKAIDFYYQKYSGFYVASPWSEFGNKPKTYPQLPDATVRNGGFTWYQALNPNRYSLRAAFNQTEFQTQSGGSPLYVVFYNHLEINLGNRFIKGSDPNSLQNLPNLASGRFDTLGAGFGYGYTFINGRYFSTIQAAISPALQFQNIDNANGRGSDRYTIAAKGNLNCATGWNHRDYVGGFKLLLDTQYSIIDQTQLWSSLPAIEVFAGSRF